MGGIFAEFGGPVIDADAVCHELLDKNTAVIWRVVAAFGKGILNRKGGIDRRALGKIVFADEKKRKKLNALVHPAARRVIRAWLKMQNKRALRKDAVAAAIIPLVYEVGWERGWDKIVCVAAPLAMQISRLRRKGLSEREARLRVAAQMSLTEKMGRADYVIFNSGTLAGLRRQSVLLFRKVNAQKERYHGRKK